MAIILWKTKRNWLHLEVTDYVFKSNALYFIPTLLGTPKTFNANEITLYGFQTTQIN